MFNLAKSVFILINVQVIQALFLVAATIIQSPAVQIRRNDAIIRVVAQYLLGIPLGNTAWEFLWETLIQGRVSGSGDALTQ